MAFKRLKKQGNSSTHRLSGGKIYYVWNNMKRRCADKRATGYKNYGGRGIKVCDRWLNFENFLEDMGSSYREGLSIDREDNDGNYELSNCKWSNKYEQSNNRRNNLILEYNGKRMSIMQWAKHLKVNRSTLSQRHYVYKWPIEKTLTFNL